MSTLHPISRMPHADVAVAKRVLAEGKPGEVISFDLVTRALGYDARIGPGYRRVKMARDQLRREGVNISVVEEGYLCETGEQTLARCHGRERRGILRKSRKIGEALAAVDVQQLSADQRAEYYATRTINNLIFMTSGGSTHQKLLAATKAAEQTLPMQKALEVLKNGK